MTVWKRQTNLTRFVVAMRLNLRVYKGMKLFHKPANFSERVESFREEKMRRSVLSRHAGRRGSAAMLEPLMLCSHRSGNFKLISPPTSVV